ncbi:hypothetical protein [uncultured Imperialibacter sp.]|uniref:DUF6962 family protein n=1 Tax=uncultured Imperialibacter sp. TaxID=1672639 RepID=UPI0030D72492|tara:strand:- start:489 stop:1169 length:681 start_codon:yes stop_codon:yes gene_type:complete
MDAINTIHLFGLRIDEPIVTITDLLVSALCIFYFYKLQKSGKTGKVFIWFKYYFLLMGIATALGGLLGHAFLYAFSFGWKLPGWIISMFAIMLIERGAIEHSGVLFKESAVKVLKVINILELLTFLSLTIFTLNFFFVEFHSGYGLMFVVLSFEGYLYLKTRNTASKNMLIGIAFAAAAALVFMNKLSPHQWFNHLALSHVLMAAATFFIYKGVQKIEVKRRKMLV